MNSVPVLQRNQVVLTDHYMKRCGGRVAAGLCGRRLPPRRRSMLTRYPGIGVHGCSTRSLLAPFHLQFPIAHFHVVLRTKLNVCKAIRRCKAILRSPVRSAPYCSGSSPKKSHHPSCSRRSVCSSQRQSTLSFHRRWNRWRRPRSISLR